MTTLKNPGFYDAPKNGKLLPTLEEREEAKRLIQSDPLLRDQAFRQQYVEESSRGGIHTLKWADPPLVVTLSKLREPSNGGLTADFDVKGRRDTVNEKGETIMKPFTYFTRINLKSGPTRATTAKDIAKIAQGFIGGEDTWRYVIERTCNYVRSSFNEGEPGVQLIDSKASETTEYRLWPFFQERQHSIVYGEGDSGKSFFGVLAGFLIATGREHLRMKPDKGNVCFLDYESDEATTKKRLSMVAAGFGEGIPPFFYYMKMKRPLEDDVDRVNAYLMENSIDFVIIDSAARAVLEAETSGPVNQYFNALSGLEATTLTIAHVSKTGKESEPFGSTFWYNDARATYRALATQAGSTLTMALRNYKANNGPRLPDKAYEFTFQQNMVTVDYGDLDGIPGIDENAPMHRRIETYLLNNGGTVTAKDLAESFDVSPNYMRTILTRPPLKDKMVKLEDGKWALKA